MIPRDALSECSYAWRDENDLLHISLPAFLESAGLPVNETSMRVAVDVLRRQFNIPMIVFDEGKRADA